MAFNSYQKTAIATVIATLFLIFVGGLVRAAGAGLGCPDWPKCFGMWIPPTSLAELPASFDPSQFNVFKTWIEYVNRLIGVIIGLFIIATTALSIRYRKSDPAVFRASLAAFVLVLFQGWLGGQVVETGLSEWLITIHMMLAFLIVNILLFAAYKANDYRIRLNLDDVLRKQLFQLGVVLLLITLVQVVIGTQVREMVDMVKEQAIPPPRSTWLDDAGLIFQVHRVFSWFVVLAAGVLYMMAKKEISDSFTLKVLNGIMILIVIQAAAGIGLKHLSMPAVLQVTHLTSVAVLVCAEFLFLLILSFSARREAATAAAA
jgi:cytochrome c oxidase assembly protein subunit 15